MPSRVPNATDILGWQNARSYGAKGDGVADDTVAIQAALAAGQVAYLPPGRYLLSGSLTVGARQTLLGAGTGATAILSASITAPAIVMGVGPTYAASHLRDFTLSVPPGITKPVGYHEIRVDWAWHSSIERIEMLVDPLVSNAKPWGAFLFGNEVKGIWVHEVSCHGFPRFATISSAIDLYFDKIVTFSNIVNGPQTPHFEVINGEAINVTDSDLICPSTANSCIVHFGGTYSRFGKFTSVYLDSGPVGVLVDGGANQIDFTASWFSTRPGRAIHVADAVGGVPGGEAIRVIGGQVENSGDGFYFGSGSGHLVSGVSLTGIGSTDSPATGVRLGAGCTGAIVVNNRIASTNVSFAGRVGTGVLIDSGAANYIVKHNNAIGCDVGITNNAATGSGIISENLQ